MANINTLAGPVKSILDTDLYKLTMQAAVLAKYPDVEVSYNFINRNLGNKFTEECLQAIRDDVAKLAKLSLSDDEFRYLRDQLPFLSVSYLEYLKNYRFDPNELFFSLENGELRIAIRGLWHRTILWEVPLMAIISENYFKYIDIDWDMEGQRELIEAKGDAMTNSGLKYADYGTRRRRNFETQRQVVEVLSKKGGFVGTSNVFLAYIYNVTALGTMAHEWIMGHMVLGGIQHCNRFALEAWSSVFEGSLGTALTDTIGSEAFFKDFSPVLARQFDSVRHDSGDPYEFVDKVINHYQKVKIDPTTKTIIFSDGLDVATAIAICAYCKGNIRCVFGIGTHLTNDFQKKSDRCVKSKALNIVIKLFTIMGKFVVKLSDTPSKATGDNDALRVTRWIVLNEPLDGKVA